jgi:hypothetical protein
MPEEGLGHDPAEIEDHAIELAPGIDCIHRLHCA